MYDLRPFRYWCQKVLPLVYDDSLTYYELLCKVINYLNNVIENVNELSENFDELKQMFNTLKQYVDNYFKNLDVQEEINKKLDEMVSDGSLNILLQMHSRMVLPSNDTSGNTDTINIQAMLDKFGYVELFTGIYYTNKPLKLKSGNAIIGSGNNNSIIECTSDFCTFVDNNSADKLVLKDFRAHDVDGSHIGLNFNGTTSTPYTGIRYSFIENVHLLDFNCCINMRGAWCVKFNHCRFESINICVNQSGTCNNVEYTECQFYGKQNVSTGLQITGDNGSENYGIYVNNCDFEKHKFGLILYSCVGVTLSNLYVEKIDTVINADNAVDLVLNCGTLNFVNRVANINRSSQINLYAATTFTMTNVSIKYDKTEISSLVYVSNEVPVYIDNITLVNYSGGAVYLNNTDSNTSHRYNGNYYIEHLSTGNINGRYTNSHGVIEKTDGIKRRDSVKLIDAKLLLVSGTTIDKTTTANIVDTKGNILYSFVVHSGSYEDGHIFNGTPTNNYYKLISRNINITASFSSPTGNTDNQFRCDCTFAIGEMQPRTQVLISTTHEVESDI